MVPFSLRQLFEGAFPLEKGYAHGHPFPESHQRAQRVHYEVHTSETIKAIDELFEAVDFDSAAETILPENVEATKRAFEHFLDRSGLILSQYAFRDTLKENTDDYAFRADGTTPNWYHFFRQVLPKLNDVRNGLISEETLNKHGGLDTLIAATLYHDSWEDHGKTPHTLFARMEKYVCTLSDDDKISEAEEYGLRRSAAEIAAIVDYCSRKHPTIGPDWQFIRKPEGGFKKTPRFGGDLNAYYNTHFQHPFALWIKWHDSGEGASTRELPDMLERRPEQPFSVESNVKFASERRALYGRRANIDIGIQKWPDFEKVFRSADSMLGINIVTLETVNDYAQNPMLLPENAMPMNISQYIEDARNSTRGMPEGWSSCHIHIEKIEDIAKRHPRFQEVLDYVIYPSMTPLIGDRRDPDLRTGYYSVSFER